MILLMGDSGSRGRRLIARLFCCFEGAQGCRVSQTTFQTWKVCKLKSKFQNQVNHRLRVFLIRISYYEFLMIGFTHLRSSQFNSVRLNSNAKLHAHRPRSPPRAKSLGVVQFEWDWIGYSVSRQIDYRWSSLSFQIFTPFWDHKPRTSNFEQKIVKLELTLTLIRELAKSN